MTDYGDTTKSKIWPSKTNMATDKQCCLSKHIRTSIRKYAKFNCEREHVVFCTQSGCDISNGSVEWCHSLVVSSSSLLTLNPEYLELNLTLYYWEPHKLKLTWNTGVSSKRGVLTFWYYNYEDADWLHRLITCEHKSSNLFHCEDTILTGSLCPGLITGNFFLEPNITCIIVLLTMIYFNNWVFS